MVWVTPYTRIRFGRLEHVTGHYRSLPKQAPEANRRGACACGFLVVTHVWNVLAELMDAKRYALVAAAQNAKLTGTVNSVPVTLTIGGNICMASVRAKLN